MVSRTLQNRATTIKRQRRGFTLVELLVTLGIIMLLAALLLGVFTRVREQGRKSECASNLGQLGVACLQYAQDNPGTFPLRHALDAVQPYVHSTGLFACPSDFGFGFPLDSIPNAPFSTQSWYHFSSYDFNTNNLVAYPSKYVMPPLGIGGINEIKVSSPGRVVLSFERCAYFPFSWHDGLRSTPPVGYTVKNGGGHGVSDARSNICFVDGHVKYIKIYRDLNSNMMSIGYNPPIAQDGTSDYEYQWTATP